MAKKGKKKYRLKKSVRRTIAALLMITAIIVAALPAPVLQADEPSDTFWYDVPGEGVTFRFSTYTEDGDTVAHINAYNSWNENGQGKESKDEIETLNIPEKVKHVEENEEHEYLVTAIDRIDAADESGNSNSLKVVNAANTKITTIGAGCFQGDLGLESVSLPDTLKSIEKEAFMDCVSLSTFSIPASVTELGTSCFENSGVKNVSIDNSDGLLVLPGMTFKNSDLQSITFNSNSAINSIGSQAFYGCSNLSSVNLPDSVTEINSEAFLGCSALNSIKIPNNVSSIGDGAFKNCSRLASVEGLESCKIDKLENNVFYECEKLRSITLPDSCKSFIGNEAFYDCGSLTEVYLPMNISDIPSGFFAYAPGITKFTLINNDGQSTDYPRSEYGDCKLGSGFLNANTNLTIYGFKYFDDQQSNIYNYAYENGITFVDLGNGGSAEASGITMDRNGVITRVDPTILTDTSLVIPPTVKVNGEDVEVREISDTAFPDDFDYPYVQIELPESCTVLGADAFKNCSNLERLIAPGMFTSVGVGALKNNNSRLEVSGKIDANNELFLYCMNNTIGGESSKKQFYRFHNSDYADEDVGYYLTVSNESGTPHSEGGLTTLIEYTPLSVDDRLTIPTGINELGVTFQNNQRLNELIALDTSENGSQTSDALKRIPDYEFMGNINLTKVQLPASLEVFGYSDGKTPFYGCTSLSDIDFGSNPRFTCDNGVVFGPDSNGDAMKKIYEALEGNSSLTNYSIPEQTTEIDPAAFYGNKYLESLTTVKATQLKEIPENAFAENVNLSAITLGQSITKIGDTAFANAGAESPMNVENGVHIIKVKVYNKMEGYKRYVGQDRKDVGYGNSVFAGNQKGVREYHLVGVEESEDDATYHLANTSQIDGLIWGDSEDIPPDPEGLDDLNNTDYFIKVLTSAVFSGTEFDKRLEAETDFDVYKRTLSSNGTESQQKISKRYYREKDNGWTIHVDGKNSSIEFRAYGDGLYYEPDSFVTGYYPVTVSGNTKPDEPVSKNSIYYVEELKPDIFEYTGMPVEPELTVRLIEDPLTILTKNKDYYVDYTNNYYPGTALATVKGINKYSNAADASEDFYIRKNIGDCPIEVENAAYTGQLCQPTVHVFDFDSMEELAVGKDYVVSRYENNVKKGKNTATAYVEGIGNYYGNNFGKFSILKTTSSTSKSSSSSSSSSKSSSSSSSSSSTSSSSESTSSSSSAAQSSNSAPVNQSPGTSGRTVPVDTGDTGLGDASGSIEGGTDNYVVKITKTAEADAAFNKALEDRFGDLSGYRQFAMDISLYDSTGEHKIEDPQGVQVTLTVPIPEDLALYGGNNKVAAVDHNGNLENLSTRYSMIDGAPCATFTATHFSPYGFYVDVNNLSAGDLDNTPKTGDPISPKWVIAIGLAALSIFLFLKKDPVANAAKA